MTRRPLVWLLGLLALSGVGWLVYERADAPEPVARSAGPQPEIEEAAPRPAAPSDTAALGPPATAVPGGTDAPAVALSAPGAESPAPSAPEPDPSARPTTGGPGASGGLASPPGAPAGAAGGPPAPPDPAAGGESAVSAAPALAPKAAASAPTAPEAAAASGQAAPSAPAVDPAPPPRAPRDVDWARLRALAPGAPPVAEPRDRPDPPSDAAASAARTEATPAPTAAPREEPAPGRAAALDEEPAPARAAALEDEPAPAGPATLPEDTAPAGPATLPDKTASAGAPPAPTGAPSEGTRRGPDTPAIESGAPPSAPAAGATTAERPAGVPRVLASIRRMLAALLGGSPDPTEPTLPGAVVIDRSSDGSGNEPTEDAAASAAPPQDVAAGMAEVVRPSFDIVRVERDGRAVVAGRAAPGAEVELRAGDRVLDRVRASARGEWVAIPPEPLAVGGQELTVAARSAGSPEIEADQVAVVAVPEPAPPEPAAGPEAAGEAVAMLLPRDGRGSGRILQAPGRISGDGQLALLVLDYDDAGRIRLTGEAPPGAPVRIYVDNQPSSEVVVEPSGRWSATLEHRLAPGDYMLRLDQLGGEGRPVARLETPFTRVSQPPVAGAAEVDYVVVQPGNSLWRIARRLFGAGFKYVHIYDANQAQIRDPDLIYPGQVFEVPAAAGAAG